ncbi:hypothetical protein Sgou_00800 [Streptomyces gougerotii]|nr:hypothetical protein [Streptomyces gougerotii]GFH75410.1 hypothetical protein Sgou_00800 [Streptomyces gougerotii]
MSINLNGRPTKPFRVRGLPVEDLFAHYDNPDGIADLDRAIDTNLLRRPVADILTSLEDLDATLLAHHAQRTPGSGADGDPTTFVD